MNEYLMITTGDFIHLTDDDLKKKRMSIDAAIDSCRKILFDVVVKRPEEDFFVPFWSIERGYSCN